jgi:hypothetical protein
MILFGLRQTAMKALSVYAAVLCVSAIGAQLPPQQ